LMLDPPSRAKYAVVLRTSIRHGVDNGSTFTGRGRRPAFESQGPFRPRSSAVMGYLGRRSRCFISRAFCLAFATRRSRSARRCSPVGSAPRTVFPR
jgi:hypothetical protein